MPAYRFEIIALGVGAAALEGGDEVALEEIRAGGEGDGVGDGAF